MKYMNKLEYKGEKMSKVVHLLDSSSYSGAEKIAIELIENDSNNEVWYVSKEGPIREVLESRNIKFFLYKNFNELRRFFKDKSFDIVHCHDYKASIKGSILKAKIKISHIHNNSITSTRINIKTLLYLIASIKFNKIIYVSNVTKEEFIFKKFLNKKSCVIPNWINKYERTCSENLVRDIDILYVGRLSEEKNPKEIIRLAKSLKNIKDNLKVHIVGNGDLEHELKEDIRRDFLEHNVYLEGFTDNPQRYMKRAKILVVPSRWEGFGLVILEAMLNGCIVFGSCVGGIKDIIKNGENAFFYEEYKSEKLLLEVIENYEKYNLIREKAFKCLESYDLINNTRQIYNLYSELLKDV